MKLLATIALALLTGCTTVPVSGFAVCVVCRVTIKAAPPQSVAEKAGSLAGGLLADYFNRSNK